jgi:hypothetical protein
MDTKTKLIRVAARLKGEWFYNELESSGTVFYLHNRSGLFIKIATSVYGCKLPQWTLSFFHKGHKQKNSVETIGCSLEKSVEAIALDVQTRLLHLTGTALQKFSEASNKFEADKRSRAERQYMIEALSKVAVLEKHNYSRTYETYDIGENITVHHQSGEWFDVSIKGINLDTLIKLIGIVN